MKKTQILLFVFICLAWNVKTTSAQKKTDVQSPEGRMFRDVSILAADSLCGREAGTRGEKMASSFLSAQMQRIGLQPKGDSDSSYLNRFRMNDPSVYTDAKLQINGFEFIYKKEFGITDLSVSGNVNAPLINLGKGSIGSASQTCDSLGKDVVYGKIVVIDIASDKNENGNAEILDEIVTRVKSAISRGAIGVILHNSSRKSIENLLFDSPYPQSVDVPVIYIDKSISNKISKLNTATCSMSVELNSTISQPENVIGWIDNKTSKTVVIGAHYDHVGTGNDNSTEIHNGADDNASGTAAMLELAHWAVNDDSLMYNYIFVAFSAEEKGLFGSKAFCSRTWVNHDNIAYMINLDMVGRLGCQGDTVSVLGIASSTVWDKVFDNLESPDFGIEKINGAPAFSDHSPFLKKGIPVVFFTTGLHPDYHKPQDDTERINFKGMAEVTAYVRRFIKSAEVLPEIPFQKITPLQNMKAYSQTFQ